jgi:glucose/arabinose dehydrogenase
MPRVLPLVIVGAVAASLLTGCDPASLSPNGAPTLPTSEIDGVQPAGIPTDVVTGLSSPWSVITYEGSNGDATTLISQRDDGAVLILLPSTSGPKGSMTMQRIGTVPGVVHEGEGGLLGLAHLRDDRSWLYAYETTAEDNRIIRFPLDGDGEFGSESEVVLAGLAKAGNHNGGRIAFGPDGMLYATVGDASHPDNAQDLASLNGKILRMTPTGDVPPDNPFPGSLVYSMGHRNPQGLAWDASGQLWAAEFGQDTWDEFNRIEPGGNYGWPVIEGKGDDPADSPDTYIDPWAQWPTDDASPSGLTYIDGTFFMAGLGGQRLWAIYVDDEAKTANPVEWLTGDYGRIRDVAPGPDGTLWMMTNNTDGRGSPREGDDRIVQVRLTELVEG